MYFVQELIDKLFWRLSSLTADYVCAKPTLSFEEKQFYLSLTHHLILKVRILHFKLNELHILRFLFLIIIITLIECKNAQEFSY